MRAALLTACRVTREPAPSLLADRVFAQRSILFHQVRFALSQECEQIVILCQLCRPNLTDIQQLATQSRAELRVLAEDDTVVGYFAAHDCVLVCEDGVMPDVAWQSVLLERPGKVLAYPATKAVPLGFERIDAKHAWAGYAQIDGAGLEGLAALPDDIDIPSALMRIALQTGAAIQSLPFDPSSQTMRLREPNDAALQEMGDEWLVRQLRLTGFAAPVTAVLQRLFANLPRRILLARSTKIAIMATVAGMTPLSLLLAYVQHAILAFVALVAAAIALVALSTINRFEAILSYRGPASHDRLTMAFQIAIIGSIALTNRDIAPPLVRFFAPMVMFGLITLVQRSGDNCISTIAHDLALLSLLLLVASFFSATLGATMLVSLAFLAVLLFEKPLRNGRTESMRTANSRR